MQRRAGRTASSVSLSTKKAIAARRTPAGPAGISTRQARNLATRKVQRTTGQPNDVHGKAIVLHAQRDDYKTQPSGDSGARVACGVIN